MSQTVIGSGVVRLTGSTSGYTEITAPAEAGSNTLILPTGNGTADQVLAGNGSGTLSFVDRGRMVLETAKNATILAVFFLDIPSWVKRITVMLNEVSTNGSSIPLIQLGDDSGGIEITGYNSVCISVSAISNNTTRNETSTAGILLGTDSNNSAGAITGNISINKISGNTWITTGNFTGSNAAGNSVYTTISTKTLSSTLDRIRIITADPFDDGTINILYEG